MLFLKRCWHFCCVFSNRTGREAQVDVPKDVAFGLKDPYWMERGLGVKSIEAVDDGLQAAPRVAGRYRRAPIDR